MSGGVVGAEAGTLTFMLGAASDVVPRVADVLSMMGKRVIHLGDQGSGLCGKLANNYLLALNNIATAEAMSMGIRWGLDPKALDDSRPLQRLRSLLSFANADRSGLSCIL